MAFCTACGQDAGTATFCPKCGASQETTATVTPAMAGSGVSSAPATAGIEENIAGLLCYAPIVGWIIALVLFLIDKRSFVKFHAVQALGVYVGIIVLFFAMGIFMVMLHLIHIFFLGLLLYPVLWLGTFVLMIFMMVKAYSHERYKLPVIGDFAENLAGK